MTSPFLFLPPKGLKARRLAVGFLSLAPFLFGLLALGLGPDANWDFRNYHWYNAYAFLTGRIGFDLVPSQVPSFYNPALDLPYYLLATHVSARLAAFILGSVQGLNVVLLFLLAHAALLIPNARQKVWACALIALLGMFGGGGIAQIGTTFYDNITSLGFFASALLVLRFWPRFFEASWGKALGFAFLCGLPAGLMMGLKLPSALFCVGLCGALLFVTGPLTRRVWIAFGFGLGVLLGLACSYGPWGFFLYTHYGNPLFPYFTGLFPAPLDPPATIRDVKFVPTSWSTRLLFPFLFTRDPSLVGEILWRDLRLPLLYVLLPVAVALRLLFGRNKRSPDRFSDFVVTRYLLWFAVVSYTAWIAVFAIYRYALPLEMLAPLLLVLSIGLLPVRLQPRTMLAVFALLAVTFTIQPGDWGHGETWLAHPIEVTVPPIKDPETRMILMAGIEPYSYVLPAFPPEIPFIRVQSNFLSPDQKSGFNEMIRHRVFAHKGQLSLLIPEYSFAMARGALADLGLSFSEQKCQAVTDRLFPSRLVLCDVQRSNVLVSP